MLSQLVSIKLVEDTLNNWGRNLSVDHTSVWHEGVPVVIMASDFPNESRGETPTSQSIKTLKSNGIGDKKPREKPREKMRK